MKLIKQTILITGGATGIGFELAKLLINKGNTVIVCGRREDKLLEAKNHLPELIIKQCDLSDTAQRRELYEFCSTQFPQLNILINNAGIQREIDFKKGEIDLLAGSDEISINFEATVNLTALFTPFLMQQQESAIVTITSGLGLVPLAIVPVYSATKAALHSFCVSLRKQLENTNIKVFEVLPPVVDTDLDKGARDKRGQKNKGISAEKVAIEAIQSIEKNKLEIPVGLVKLLRIGSRIKPNLFFNILNKK